MPPYEVHRIFELCEVQNRSTLQLPGLNCIEILKYAQPLLVEEQMGGKLKRNSKAFSTIILFQISHGITELRYLNRRRKSNTVLGLRSSLTKCWLHIRDFPFVCNSSKAIEKHVTCSPTHCHGIRVNIKFFSRARNEYARSRRGRLLKQELTSLLLLVPKEEHHAPLQNT